MKKGKVVAELAEAVTVSRFLPEEIIMNVLFRLPVKSISRFRCVCKPWFNLFKSPSFIKMHLEDKKCKLMLIEEDNIMYTSIDFFDPSSVTCYGITSIDYPFKEKENSKIGVDVVGSCNGLLCLTPTPYSSIEERICLWNPSTKEYKKLSIPEDQILMSDLEFHGVNIVYGFGYDCKIEDYKLVRILTVFVNDDHPVCEVKVYTLLPNKWENIPGTHPYEIASSGVIVNGTLHWVAYRHTTGGSYSSKSVVSFDFRTERFLEVPIPEHLDDKMFTDVGDLRSCLCIFSTRHHEDGFVVWVMKDYGVRESWTKLFTIVQQSLVKPCYKLIQSFKIGEILLYIESKDSNSHVDHKYDLVLYNPENGRVRSLEICGDWSDATTPCWSDAKTYLETLVSLKSGRYLVQGRVVEPKAVEGEEAYDVKEEKQEKDDVGQERVAEPKRIETEEAYGEKEEQEMYDVASSLLLLKHEK